MSRLENFIGGAQRRAPVRRYAELINPSTGEAFAEAPVSGLEDVDDACRNALGAFAAWRRTTPSQRSRALLLIADALEARADEIVALETREHRQADRRSRSSEEIPPMIDQIRFFAGAARMLEGRGAAEYMAGHTSYVRREPIGVCAAVTPWNYPMMMAVWKWAPALAAGNTMVLKPSDTTPVSTLFMAELMAEFLPPGVLNVVCGDRDTGRRVVEHPTPQMVSITGRSALGRRSPRRRRPRPEEACTWSSAARRPSSSSTTPTSPSPPRDRDRGYFNAGQDCTAATRVLAGPRVYGDFVDALVRAGTRDAPGPARRRGRALRPGQQRQPARAGVRFPRPEAFARHRRCGRLARRGSRLLHRSRPWSPAFARTTR